MVDTARVRIYEVKGRHSVHLPSMLIRDSAFPFHKGDELQVRIDGEKLVLEKIRKAK